MEILIGILAITILLYTAYKIKNRNKPRKKKYWEILADY